MEGSSDVVRVKEEPSNTWMDAGDDIAFGSMVPCKVENPETFPLHEVSAKGYDQVVSIQERVSKFSTYCYNKKPNSDASLE
ncbi:hypothetical protein TKK_0017802 [Trichogramma kaykai]